MLKCPNCGHEVSQKRPGYHGRLIEYADNIEAMFKAGATVRDIAREVNDSAKVKEILKNLSWPNRVERVDSSEIRRVLKRLGYDIPAANRSSTPPERNAEICRLRKSGLTYDEIAIKFDISGCRVGQIIHKHERAERKKSEAA